MFRGVSAHFLDRNNPLILIFIDDWKANIDDGKAIIDDGKANIDDGKACIDDGKANIDDGKACIDDVKANIGRRTTKG